eukprot:TRINITY_DN1837_c0_g1_i1.p1 TRINITY_DN1837_c0_g1~~TRINITY_DN1837_c0_g1_i1.p1  ORF type:complete len:202 (-),score=18.62 TRINITY_DN1837_c0_g1_i1:206-811(-)
MSASEAVRPRNRDELCILWRNGVRIPICQFYGHTPKSPGVVDKSCLSQFYPAEFTDKEGTRYVAAEHYMMATKARFFGDMDALTIILSSPDPAKAKAAGRSVKNFDAEAWARVRYATVVEGNRLKFSQNPALGEFLRSTRQDVLVEAVQSDCIWGNGRAMGDLLSEDPTQWRGENLLGFALMDVRDALAAADAASVSPPGP